MNKASNHFIPAKDASMGLNIFGDIAGNFKTFKALLDKMPKGQVISLGDLNDRGPYTKSLIQWMIDNNGQSLLGNHEHMFIDFYRSFLGNDNSSEYKKPFYPQNIWLDAGNGGWKTLNSYGITKENIQDLHQIIPKSHIEWLESRPFWIETEDLLLTHAPKMAKKEIASCTDIGMGLNLKSAKDSLKLDSSLLWNRARPRKESKLQIFGHNASDNVMYYSRSFQNGIKRKPEDEVFAICLDSSFGNVLSALHCPTMEIFQQEIID